jgi:hypothetical protein
MCGSGWDMKSIQLRKWFQRERHATGSPSILNAKRDAVKFRARGSRDQFSARDVLVILPSLRNPKRGSVYPTYPYSISH